MLDLGLAYLVGNGLNRALQNKVRRKYLNSTFITLAGVEHCKISVICRYENFFQDNRTYDISINDKRIFKQVVHDSKIQRYNLVHLPVCAEACKEILQGFCQEIAVNGQKIKYCIVHLEGDCAKENKIWGMQVMFFEPCKDCGTYNFAGMIEPICFVNRNENGRTDSQKYILPE